MKMSERGIERCFINKTIKYRIVKRGELGIKYGGEG
jgi:hypothetical protein